MNKKELKESNNNFHKVLDCARDFKEIVDELMADSREKSLALTKIDEATFWIVAFYSGLK